MSTPYPPKNSVITFLEPYPRVEKYNRTKWYYIKACVNGLPEQEIRMDKKQQLSVVDYLLQVDGKLTGAVVDCDSQGRFVVLQHSPQSDFFELAEVK